MARGEGCLYRPIQIANPRLAIFTPLCVTKFRNIPPPPEEKGGAKADGVELLDVV